MNEEHFDQMKSTVLENVQAMFEEIEETMAMKHQEKYSLLEDAFENATDVSELRIAFEQWHMEHAEDLEIESEIDEMWDAAIASIEEGEDEFDYDDEDEEEELA